MVLLPFGKHGMRRVDAIDRVWKLRQAADVSIPKKFEATVQSAYNHHCSESDVFRVRNAKPEDALFYPVARKGSGRWAVNQERAEAWVRLRQFELGQLK